MLGIKIPAGQPGKVRFSDAVTSRAFIARSSQGRSAGSAASELRIEGRSLAFPNLWQCVGHAIASRWFRPQLPCAPGCPHAPTAGPGGRQPTGPHGVARRTLAVGAPVQVDLGVARRDRGIAVGRRARERVDDVGPSQWMGPRPRSSIDVSIRGRSPVNGLPCRCSRNKTPKAHRPGSRVASRSHPPRGPPELSRSVVGSRRSPGTGLVG